jgi:hypothetical protein
MVQRRGAGDPGNRVLRVDSPQLQPRKQSLRQSSSGQSALTTRRSAGGLILRVLWLGVEGNAIGLEAAPTCELGQSHPRLADSE